MKLLNRMKKQVALATITTLALSTPVATMASDYSSHWAKDVITEWNAYGVVKGYEDGSFKPNNNMTRAEFAVVLSNVFGLVDTDKSVSFSDVSANAWYQDAINKVAAAGMMQGANGRFNPKATITRQEVAVALVNAFNVTEKGNGNVKFTDDAAIASWAKEQVELMASKGYISGRVNGQFDPKANITRAEVLKMLDNMTVALFNKAGTYTTDAEGNVIVNTQNVILKDMTVSGDLYLAQGINLGGATLEDVTVEGNIFVAGGGVNSIHFNQVTAKKPVQVKAKKAVRLVSNNSQISVVVETGQEVVLTGAFKEVIVPVGATLELKGATVEKITVLPGKTEQAAIKIDKTSVVKELVANAGTKVTGEGKLEKLYVNANGVSTTMKPGQVINNGGYDYKAPTTSGGGGGGSSTPSTPSTPDTPAEQAYIEVSSIQVDGKELLNKGISISKNEVTIDMPTILETVEAAGLEEITSAKVQFANLKKGDKVVVTAKIPSLTVNATRTHTISEDGTVEYTVKKAVNQWNVNKDRIMNKLKYIHADKHIQTILSKFGLDLEQGVYLEDGSINVATLLTKYEQALNYFENQDEITAEESMEAINFFKNLLTDCGGTLEGRTLTIGKDTAKASLTIQAEALQEANYSLVIKF